MAELISRERLLIGDPVGANQAFADSEVQAALDRHQTVVRYALLHPEPSYAVGGAVEHRDYYAGVGDWESDEQLFNAAWQQLAPASRDRLVGHWTFASPGQPPPVRILGKVYDVFGAAADLLEAWAARVKLEFDFDTDGQQFARSQKAKALLQLAAEYRRKQRPSMATLVRSDVGS